MTAGSVGKRALDDPVEIFEYQEKKVLNQANPVNGTWYTIGLTDGVMTNAIIYDVAVNVEDTNETLGIQILIDGKVIPPSTLAATHSTTYHAFKILSAIAREGRIGLTGSAEVPRLGAYLIEGKSVEVQVRKTTAAGTGNLTGVVTWGKKA